MALECRVFGCLDRVRCSMRTKSSIFIWKVDEFGGECNSVRCKFTVGRAEWHVQ